VERPAEAEVRPTDDAQAVGLGVGSLLAPPARVSEYMFLVIDIKGNGFISLSNVPQNLCTSIIWDFFYVDGGGSRVDSDCVVSVMYSFASLARD